MSIESWVAIAVGISTIMTSLLLGLRWVIKSYLSELKPNSGSSLADKIDRLEKRVDDLFILLSKS